jgi:menaquinone-9 beta-reductase
MSTVAKYDVAIVGGGLAGLSLSIQLAKMGFAVVLFEKEQYPFHKVCGEYISLESWNFIESLGLPLSKMQLPIIKKLMVTAPNGTALQQGLPLGGFGISRYKIDNDLKAIALASGVTIMENCKAEAVIFVNEVFEITTTAGSFISRVCCGSFGKRSNLDVKWNRNFVLQKPGKLNNYIGVKYHITTHFPSDTIALHNFKDGYCGISQIEDYKYCLCYLTNAKNLKDNGNSIEAMEKNVLHKNPHLKAIFQSSEILYKTPVTISQISFAQKEQVYNHILLIGDAAGMITPLCGNGMSIALHGSKIAAAVINNFLQQKITREQLEKNYQSEWAFNFKKRLQTGRFIQKLFGKTTVTNLFISLMKKIPALTTALIKQTHGKPF